MADINKIKSTGTVNNISYSFLYGTTHFRVNPIIPMAITGAFPIVTSVVSPIRAREFITFDIYDQGTNISGTKSVNFIVPQLLDKFKIVRVQAAIGSVGDDDTSLNISKNGVGAISSSITQGLTTQNIGVSPTISITGGNILQCSIIAGNYSINTPHGATVVVECVKY